MVPYTIRDPVTSQTSTAFLTIVVPSQDAPVAVDDFYTCPFNAACAPATGLLANDSTSGAPLEVVDVPNPPPTGSLVWNPDGTFTYLPERCVGLMGARQEGAIEVHQRSFPAPHAQPLCCGEDEHARVGTPHSLHAPLSAV